MNPHPPAETKYPLSGSCMSVVYGLERQSETLFIVASCHFNNRTLRDILIIPTNESTIKLGGYCTAGWCTQQQCTILFVPIVAKIHYTALVTVVRLYSWSWNIAIILPTRQSFPLFLSLPSIRIGWDRRSREKRLCGCGPGPLQNETGHLFYEWKIGLCGLMVIKLVCNWIQ